MDILYEGINMDIDKYKLIIWDLDKTLWNGILGEGNADIDIENVNLIKNIVDSGVMCSICSNNDYDDVKTYLETANIWDYFVFPSINYSPKGDRVKEIVSLMQLRSENVLFIDDDIRNRNEIVIADSRITVCDEKIVEKLQHYYTRIEKNDLEHNRLKRYKLLERKNEFKAKIGNNEEFLFQSNIKVTINLNCGDHIDRIVELVNRTNQLNYTKQRDDKKEIEKLVLDPNCKTGYVLVSDIYGDYGICGFFAIKDDIVKHFLFSCRIINMGVEQWVYNEIGKPQIDIIGDVVSDLEGTKPAWINQKDSKTNVSAYETNMKVLLKGPCDMDALFSFIKDNGNIRTEFTYIGRNGVSIEGVNHTVQIKESLTLDLETKRRISRELPFGDDKMFDTDIWSPKISVVVYSLITDCNLGLYKEKASGVIVAFGNHLTDLTDEKTWDDFIHHRIFTANCIFTKENLTKFKNKYEYLGRLSPEKIMDNILFIRNNMSSNTFLVLMLGSEVPYTGKTPKSYLKRHLFHSEVNDMICKWADKRNDVLCLNFSDYIKNQEDYTDSINHFQKRIYFNVTKDLIKILEEHGCPKLESRSYLSRFMYKVKSKMKEEFTKR